MQQMSSKVPATALPQHSPEQVKCGTSELLLMWTFSLYKCLHIITCHTLPGNLLLKAKHSICNPFHLMSRKLH